MPGTIAAIPMEYRGVRFRSKLEGEWARFYDEIGVGWDYEPKRFVLSSGATYLPDFWLPDLKCWVEIKGPEPTDVEEWRLGRLVQIAGATAYCAYGSISSTFDGKRMRAYFKSDGEKLYRQDGFSWCECGDCGRVEISFCGRAHPDAPTVDGAGRPYTGSHAVMSCGHWSGHGDGIKLAVARGVVLRRQRNAHLGRRRHPV